MSGFKITPPAFSREELQKFAEFAVCYENPMDAAVKAAEAIYGKWSHEVGIRSLLMSQWLPRDERVIEIAKKLGENADLESLPSKGQYTRKLLDLADATPDIEIKLKYLQLVGQTMGYVNNKGTEVNTTINNELPKEPTYKVVKE